MKPADWPEGDVEANGLKLHYHRAGGKKPVIVLLHGITDNALCWTSVAQELAGEFDLVMPDARGHGLSQNASDGYAPQAHAADVKGLIDALNLRQPVLMGHSMGGQVATLVAATWPDLPRAVILEDPAWSGEETEAQRKGQAAFAAEWRHRLITEQDMTPEELVAQGKRDNGRWGDADFGPWAQAKRQVRPDVLDWITAERPSWQALLPQIKAPGLLITGDPALGVIIDPDWAGQAAAAWPGLEVVQIEEAGHSIRRDNFEDYMKAVREFLAKL